MEHPIATIGETITSRIAKILRTNILESKHGFEPGDRIVVEELIAELGVSATPIKDALKQLTSEGLVVSIPRRAFFVVELSESDIDELLRVREGIERWALKLVNGKFGEQAVRELSLVVDRATAEAKTENFEAYMREDIQFHRLLAGLPGNRQLSSIWEQIMNQSRSIYLYGPRLDGTSENSINEHRELIDIFARGDFSASDEAIAAHWVKARQRILAAFRSHDDKRP